MQAFAIGKDTLLQGEYRLLEAIGGAHSRVYLATRETNAKAGSVTGSPLVIARLWQPSAALLREHGAQALFERAVAQMRAATLLRHPILAMVETCGALEDGTLYLISEHYEGTPLDSWIDSAGIPPLPTVIDLAYRICSGLNAAHRNGLGHASLHPRSIIVRPPSEGGAVSRMQAKLIDFGAPTCMFASPPSLHAARFMAPEQLELAMRPAIERGEPTVRMNVYGCGALLYYLCTGGPPLPGQSVDELMVAHAAHKVLPPSRINPQVIPALDAIILKALDAQPRARYANAAELANALISIRFERSASGVRHRALTDQDVEQLDRKQRDRRVTLDLNGEAAPDDAGNELEERPTSKTQRPDVGARDALAFERPTAQISAPPPSIPTPLPPLTPPPPSLPPAVADEDITAEAPLPARAPEELVLRAPAPALPSAPPPAVLARPARHSMQHVNDLIGRVPPWVYIALAALCSLSIIYAVISGPSGVATTIAVTPLPIRAPKPEVAEPPAHASAGASATLSKPERDAVEPTREPAGGPAREAREPRPRRVARASEPARSSEPARPPAPVEPTAPREAPALKLQPLAPPEPASEPVTPAHEAANASAPPAPEPAAAPAAPERPAASPPKSAIAPLPEAQVKPLSPLPEKAVPRFYDLEVKGSLATSQVRRGVERTLGATQDCYRDALTAHPSALGELSLEVLVDERGRAREVTATGAAPKALRRCIESAARRLTVPPPDTGTVTATWKVSIQ